MVEVHRQRLSDLIERTLPPGRSAASIECKHFFSGAAAYADGVIFMTLTSVGLALKLPESRRSELLEEGAVPLRYFRDGPVKKDYVVLPEAMAGDEAALRPLIAESMDFCSSTGRQS